MQQKARTANTTTAPRTGRFGGSARRAENLPLAVRRAAHPSFAVPRAASPSPALRPALALLVACALALGCAPTLGGPVVAFAATDDIEADPDALQQRIEETSKAYDEAVERVAGIERRIEENEGRISQMEAELPGLQERGADAARTLYKLQQEGHGLVDVILGAESLTDFLTTFEYVDRIQKSNLADIESLRKAKDELDDVRNELAQAKDEAYDEQEKAEEALAEAQEAREEAQRKAQEAAAKLAEERKREAEQEAAAQEEKRKQEAQKEKKQAEDAKKAEQNEPDEGTGSETVVAPPTNDVDWGDDKTAFVDKWAPRIDAYLSGSPMAGQGTAFAKAAWDYGVDPRWSPAIANTESSKGAYCANAHNAWGWGNVSWSSWEEAIDAHVRGLARGYGYTISPEAAKKYCPPTWEHWYNVTLAQMNMI